MKRIWPPHMDAIQFVRNQQEAAGKAVQLPPPQAAPIIKAFTAVVTLVAPPAVVLVIALALWGLFRLLYGADVSFKQSFTIVAWCFALIALVTIPLLLGAMALKDGWNDDPGLALAANATLFLDRESASAIGS